MIEVKGYDDLNRMMQEWPKLYQHRTMQAVHFQAAKPLVEKEKEFAPRRTGKLASSHGITKPAFTKAAAIGEVHVGPRRGRFGGAHAHFFEFGTKPRNFKGANRGTIGKRPYIEPAFNQTKDKVVEVDRTVLAQKTLAFMKRFVKRHG